MSKRCLLTVFALIVLLVAMSAIVACSDDDDDNGAVATTGDEGNGAAATTDDGKTYKLRLAHTCPAEALMGMAPQKFADLVDEYTDGRV